MQMNCASFIRRLFSHQLGQTLPAVGLGMVGLVAMTGLTVDVGRAYIVRNMLQTSANAAALSGAVKVYQTTSTSDATPLGITVAYQNSGCSAGSSVNCAVQGANYAPLTGTVVATVTSPCLGSLTLNGTGCATRTQTPGNAIFVHQVAQVNTFFMSVVGFPTLTVHADATAAVGNTQPWNVAIVIDSTGSMATVDNNCGGLTEFQCALTGVQSLLAGTNPVCLAGTKGCVNGTDFSISLFTFPNVLTSYNGALPQVDYGKGKVSVDSIAKDVACNGTPGSVKNIQGQPIAAPYALPVPGVALPVFGGTNGMAPLTTYQNGLNYLAYKETSTGKVWTTTYQITPFLSDYYDPGNTDSGGLKTSSELVQAVGYKSTPGCLTYTFGIDGTGGGSGYGNTYFAGAIYSAQAALAAQAAVNPGAQSALIFLSDGQANAFGTNSDGSLSDQFPQAKAGSAVGPTSASNPVPAYYTPATAVKPTGFTYFPEYDTLGSNGKGNYPDWYDQCQQAIVAARSAATDPSTLTRVYAIAYGPEASGCGNGWNYTDQTLVVANSTSLNQPFSSAAGVLPCTTMEDIASSWSYFYSDNQQTGNVNLGCTDNNHTVVSLQDIFQAITASFSTPRLISNTAS